MVPLPESHAHLGRSTASARVAWSGMTRSLEISACRSSCSWDRTGEALDREALFRCAGCGSEWVASELWTPMDHTGHIPDAVQRERSRGAL